MSLAKRPLPAVVAAVGVALAGCGGSGASRIAPAAKLENVRGSSVGQIVLSPLGAQRIGVQTERVDPAGAAARAAGRHPSVVVPYSAIVYDPSGRTYAFKQIGPFTYVEVAVKVDHIAGSAAYLVAGPRPGTRVVSVGAEELYGVQSGVLAQT